ncbi:MAG: glycosyltransferase family 2 protein [Candidatus Omnitrophica bacterium]|nr:glycosyltransferase family 2 protein [Candidatus Omnitrophota bacterium]
MKYILSICIPTYNREKYLKELLENIFFQIDDTIYKNKIEICISDNASEDNTESMIKELKEKYPYITYFKFKKNMGADANYLKVVEIANGEYCWLFGSDDKIEKNGISKILSEIKYGNDIYLVNKTECDINMKNLNNTPIFKRNIESEYFYFGTTEKLIYYFKSLNTLTGLFSYLSSIIFKKIQWDSISFNQKFIGTAYSHSFILLSMLKKDMTLKYINEYLILNRGENDAFMSEGIIKRIQLDFDGYKLLFSNIFDNNEKINIYYKYLLKKSRPSFRMLYILSNLNNTERKLLLDIIKEAPYNKILLKYGFYIYLLIPYKLLRYFYRKIFSFKNK